MPQQPPGSQQLEVWAGPLVDQLRQMDSDLGEHIFSAKDHPAIPARLWTEDMAACAGWMSYNSWSIERIHWSGTRDSFAALGVAMLGAMFQEREFELQIDNPGSEIRMVRVLVEQLGSLRYGAGLEVLPVAFRYDPDPDLQEIPWDGFERLAPEFFPVLRLASVENDLATVLQELPRDLVLIEGTIQAASRLAKLFLDLGQLAGRQPVVTLECEAGNRGVGPESHEVRFYLPELPEMREKLPFTGAFPGMPEEWLQDLRHNNQLQQTGGKPPAAE